MADIEFSINELIAIYGALEDQAESVTDLMSDPNIPINEKTQLNNVLKHNRSAFARLSAVLQSEGHSPYKN